MGLFEKIFGSTKQAEQCGQLIDEHQVEVIPEPITDDTIPKSASSEPPRIAFEGYTPPTYALLDTADQQGDERCLNIYSCLASKSFIDSEAILPVVMGLTDQGEVCVADIVRMPHLLIAGATGQGKSVALHSIIASLLFKKHPLELKLVLIDTKGIEFNCYTPLKEHFLAVLQDKPIHDTVDALYQVVMEMNRRYQLLSQSFTRNTQEYNQKFLNKSLKPDCNYELLPHIVVVIDEFKDISTNPIANTLLASLTRDAHKVGIHVILSTQRPAKEVVSLEAKENMLSRLCFKTASTMNSQLAIGESGAEKLKGNGDALFLYNNQLRHIQAPYISPQETDRIVYSIASQEGQIYNLYNKPPLDDALDSMFAEVARFVVQYQQGSTSAIQRRFSIGYNRSGRIMEQLEAAGIIGPASGSKPREVLILDMESLEALLTTI